MNLRPREASKEIGPPSFRFNSHKTGLERVYDELTVKKPTILDKSEIVDQTKVKLLNKPLNSSRY